MGYATAATRYGGRALLPLMTFAFFWGLYVMLHVRFTLHPVYALLTCFAELVAVANMLETYELRDRLPLAESSDDRRWSDRASVICLIAFMSWWGTAAARMWAWVMASESPQDWQIVMLWLLVGGITTLPVMLYVTWARKVKPWLM